MTIVTRANLRAQFERIRDETKLRANSATRVGGALIDALDSGIGTEYLPVISTTATGAENLTAIQAAVDAARTAGGGRIRLSGPPGNYPLTAPYRNTDNIYPGYVANDENRRANKAIIIYDADNIELCADPGVVLDRSGDQIADTTYGIYSTTIYVSKSSNITLRNLELRGYQEDTNLLNDVKDQTSGDHIQINSGSSRVLIENVIAQDGTTGLTIGLNRTSAEADHDPALADCTGITVRNFESRNNEHGMLLVAADGVVVEGFRARVFTRADATTGVCQRSLYFHSCRNVHMSAVELSGAFKTSILVRDYDPVTNVTIDGLYIHDMMTPAAILAARGTVIDSTYEGLAISMHASNCEDIAISDFIIDDVTTGVTWPGAGMLRVSFRRGFVNAVFNGMVYSSANDDGATLLDNPIEGLSFDDVEVRQLEDPTDYPGLTPNSGFYVLSTAVDAAAATVNAASVNTHNLRVFARNRNARLLSCDGFTTDCTFTRAVGASGARNFDFNYSGKRRFSNNLFGNNGKPNSSQDTPTASGIQGYSELSAPVKFPISTYSGLPAPLTATGALVLVTNGPSGACVAFSSGGSWLLSGPFIGY